VGELMAHSGDPEAIEQTCSDMSPAFISGIKEYLPNAENTFDRFHIMKIINEGVNEVRVEEVKENEILKKTRYIWLKNECNLTKSQKATFENISKLNLKTGKVYRMRLNFQELFTQPDSSS
jgi:transposase